MDMEIRELVGSSGTALRQASEGIAQLTNKMSKSFASMVGTDHSQQKALGTGIDETPALDNAGTRGPVRKDVVAAMFSELKPYLLAKPRNDYNASTISGQFGYYSSHAGPELGESEVNSKTRGLRSFSSAGKVFMDKLGNKVSNGGSSLGMFSDGGLSRATQSTPGGAKSSRDLKRDILAWRAEGEKVIRRNLMLFFVYIFADLDVFYKGNTKDRNAKPLRSTSFHDDDQDVAALAAADADSSTSTVARAIGG